MMSSTEVKAFNFADAQKLIIKTIILIQINHTIVWHIIILHKNFPVMRLVVILLHSKYIKS